MYIKNSLCTYITIKIYSWKNYIKLENLNLNMSKRKPMQANRSWVWEHFKLSVCRSFTTCKICDNTCPYSTSTNSMGSHLKTRHKITKSDSAAPSKKRKIGPSPLNNRKNVNTSQRRNIFN